MSWEEPKTTWANGDWFNKDDFNRIKNNLNHLKELATGLYPPFEINNIGGNRTYSSGGPFADEINDIEENLSIINANTFNKDYGVAPEYTPNGLIMDDHELNRIESATLDIYNKLQVQYSGRRMLRIKLGVPNDGFLHGM